MIPGQTRNIQVSDKTDVQIAVEKRVAELESEEVAEKGKRQAWDVSKTDPRKAFSEAESAPNSRPETVFDEKNFTPAPTLKILREDYPELRPIVIEGIAREGDVIHCPAPSKVGKSWFAIDLSISMAAGQKFLKHIDVQKGPVLYIDAELDQSDLVFRFKKVAEKRSVDLNKIDQDLSVKSYRGNLKDIYAVERWLNNYPPGTFRMIVLDALYRFLPNGTDENSNGMMTDIYNLLARIAKRAKAVVLIVAHSSKGEQGGKRQTDVGAGAGSAARTADAYLTIREHQEEGLFVFERSVRTFPKADALTLSYSFPCWDIRHSKQPELLTADGKRNRTQLIKDKLAWDGLSKAIEDANFTQSKVKKILKCNTDRAKRLIAVWLEKELIIKVEGQENEYRAKGDVSGRTV